MNEGLLESLEALAIVWSTHSMAPTTTSTTTTTTTTNDDDDNDDDNDDNADDYDDEYDDADIDDLSLFYFSYFRFVIISNSVQRTSNVL